MNPILSLAIPTHKRPDRLAETLAAFLPQVQPHGIPVCISYTEDAGRTEGVIEAFRQRYPHIAARTDPGATNIDRKIVAAVSLCRSRYVWLFGDDDLPEPGAIDRILRTLAKEDCGLLVLNGSSHSSDFSRVVEQRRIRRHEDRTYAPGQHQDLLKDTAGYATFLGGLVFAKSLWDSIDPAPFLDTDYVHVAVLYRAIAGRRATLVADPQLRIRLGATTWSDRYFEVELIHWPKVIWGLPTELYSDRTKAHICHRRPITSLSRLLAARAYGRYDWEQHRKFIASDSQIPAWKKIALCVPLMIPRPWLVRAFTIFRRCQALWGDPNLELSLYRMKQNELPRRP